MGTPDYIEYPDRRSMVQALRDARASGVRVETVDGFRMLFYPDGAPQGDAPKKAAPKKSAPKKETEQQTDPTPEPEAPVVLEPPAEDVEDLIGE